jgi:hypothetical protein
MDSALWAMGAFLQLSLLVILFWRRLYRQFPLFTASILWDALTQLLLLWVYSSHGAWYNQAYFSVLSVADLLEISVLAEIAANVLQPHRKSLPPRILSFLGVVILAVGASAFFFSAHANTPSPAHQSTIVIVNSTVAILRLVTFVLIAAFAQVLGIGWKHHVLQLASAFAFYSAIDLIVTQLQGHLHAGPEGIFRYRLLSEFLLAGYLCSLSYWCITLVRKEAVRREFSPQMSQFLVTLSGGGKRQR